MLNVPGASAFSQDIFCSVGFFYQVQHLIDFYKLFLLQYDTKSFARNRLWQMAEACTLTARVATAGCFLRLVQKLMTESLLICCFS